MLIDLPVLCGPHGPHVVQLVPAQWCLRSNHRMTVIRAKYPSDVEDGVEGLRDGAHQPPPACWMRA